MRPFRPGLIRAGLELGRHPCTVGSERKGAVLPCARWQAVAAPITAKGAVLEVGTPIALFQTAIVGGGALVPGYRQQYDVAPDGRFLINVETEFSAPPITLVLNWKPAVK